MKIKVSKAILESAQLFRAKNDVRYYLNGICFKKNGKVCATDGHRLIVQEGNPTTSDFIVKVGKSPTKRYDYALIDTDSGVCTYRSIYGDERVGVSLCEVIDGKFPDVERLLKLEAEEVKKIAFNAGYLKDLESVANLYNRKYKSVELQFQSETEGAFAEIKSPAGYKATVVIMPMRM